MRCSQEVKEKIREWIVKEEAVCKVRRGWLCWILGKLSKKIKIEDFAVMGGAGGSIFSGVVVVGVWLKKKWVNKSKGCTQKKKKRNSS